MLGLSSLPARRCPLELALATPWLVGTPPGERSQAAPGFVGPLAQDASFNRFLSCGSCMSADLLYLRAHDFLQVEVQIDVGRFHGALSLSGQ
jgi:hypothetical protein